MLRTLCEDGEAKAEDAGRKFLSALADDDDCFLEIDIDVHSWVPLVSRALPKDTIRVWNVGSKIRSASSK